MVVKTTGLDGHKISGLPALTWRQEPDLIELRTLDVRRVIVTTLVQPGSGPTVGAAGLSPLQPIPSTTNAIVTIRPRMCNPGILSQSP